MSKSQTAKQAKGNTSSAISPQRVLSLYKKNKRIKRAERFDGRSGGSGSMHRVALEATAKCFGITLGEAQELLLMAQAQEQGISLEMARKNSLRERAQRQERYDIGVLAMDIYREKRDAALEVGKLFSDVEAKRAMDEAHRVATARVKGNTSPTE